MKVLDPAMTFVAGFAMEYRDMLADDGDIFRIVPTTVGFGALDVMRFQLAKYFNEPCLYLVRLFRILVEQGSRFSVELWPHCDRLIHT